MTIQIGELRAVAREAGVRSDARSRLRAPGGFSVAALLAALLSEQVAAHAAAGSAPEGFQALSGLKGIAAQRELADHSLQITLANGRQIVLSPGQYVVMPTGIFVAPEAVASLEAALAGAGSAGAGIGLEAGLLGGVLLAGAAVAAGGDGGNGEGGTTAPANQPPSITSAAAATIAENGRTVRTVSATDPEAGRISYSISGGADAALFTIDAATGALAFVAAPDFELPSDAGRNNVYDLIVSASDGTASVTQAIVVTVTNVNDVAPVIGSAAAASIGENQTSTGLVVTATDVEGGTIVYSVAGGADAALFAIDAATGALSFIAAPDFEAPADADRDSTYEVTVRASDGTNSSTQAVRVTVTNVNDVAPVIGSAAAASISENQTSTGLVVTAADVEGGTIVYSVAGGADAARFAIDAATGALSFIAAPDFEAPADADRDSTYEVTVRASDGTNSSTQAVRVTVTNVNDVAPVIGSAAAASISENQTSTGLVVTATDVEGGTIVYSVAGGADAALFAIDAATGALSFIAAPDFEAPADADRDSTYEVTVRASDGTNSSTQAVRVTVTNVNDVAPVIGSAAAASISENQTSTGLVVTATDVEGGTIVYSVAGGADAALFAIDAATGALSFIAAPDFEAPADADRDSTYEVTVRASDGTNSSTQAVRVTVTNVNDVAPVIGSAAAASISENQTSTGLVVTAADVEGGTIVYSVAGGADAARFAIDAATGALSFIAAPDFEAPADADRDSTYEVTVRASDGTNSSTQAVRVTVTNVNDVAPVIGSAAAASISENQTSTGLVVTATDVEGGTIVYSVAGGADAALFAIDAATGALSFIAAPDFEAPADADRDSTYEVTVRASDGTNSSTQAVRVTVTNVNDVAPVIGSAAAASISENQTSTGLVVTATDVEGGTIVYSVAGGADAALFAIDAATGALSFIAAPDFEAPADADRDSTYEVTVRASDGTNSSTQAVRVTVTNVNDVAPVIGSAAAASISENQTSTGLVVTAADVEGGTIVYSVAGGADAARFAIDAATGALSFIAAPDFEAPADADRDSTYEVTVRASDGTNSSTQAVRVTVTNVNDVAPVIGSAAAASISENQTSTGLVVTATDVEGGTIVYSVAGGADAARFAIDGTTGALSFIAAPDFEAPADVDGDNTYEVTVRASDGTNSSTQAVRVTVTNVNDVAPVIGSAAAASIGENQTSTGLVVTATDVEGGAIVYSVAGGADAALFAIDAATGALSFIAAPDFEAPADADRDSTYEVTLRASDGTNSSTQAVRVTVTNVNDVAPVIGSAAAASIGENQTSTGLVVTATDVEGGTIVYSVAGGADAARFAIDGTTGALSFIAAPDFEAPADVDGDNTYEVTVRASDGTNSSTQAVRVTVTNVNDVAPVIGSAAAASIGENQTSTGLVVTATDVEGGAIVYSVAGGADAALFAIDAATGALSFIAAPDFEAPADADRDSTYEVTLRASDGTNSSTQAVRVTVTNVNDVAPVIGSAAAASISENQTSTGLVVTAADVEGGTIVYSVAGGADAARFAIDGTTGALSFIAAPDFEAPADVDGDNTYEVTLRASDGTNSSTQAVRVMVTDVVEGTPETFTAALRVDTGSSAADAITSDAGLSVTPGTGTTSITLSVDGAAAFDIVDLIAGGIVSETQIEARLGSSLGDGAHRYLITAYEGNGTHQREINFSLDQTAPGGTIALSRSSDTGTQGDGVTTAGRVTIVGSASEAGALVGGSGAALVDKDGQFTIDNVALQDGPNRLTLTVTDAAGNTTALSMDVTRVAGTGSTDQVLFWNDVALEAIAKSAAIPTYASRALAMQSIAVYDAVSAIDGSSPFMVSLRAGPESGIDAAVAYASYATLLHLFPSQKTLLDAALASALPSLGSAEVLRQGEAIGEAVAAAIIALRDTDGYDAFVQHVSTGAPGEWVPTGPLFAEAEAPQWAYLDPFTLTSDDQFRGAPPPALESAEYAAAINEVKSLGSATSTTRTADQTQIARFWQDGLGTYTPPGHWNEIAQVAATSTGSGLASNARTFALLNVALADAGIAAWDSKYTFNAWRPSTAIQNADIDGNDATVADKSWVPLFNNPAHPDDPSGHSTFSAAGAAVLSSIFGEDFNFSLTASSLPGVTRGFDSFDDAADEAGMSRIYGGIHTSYANLTGKGIGTNVGDWVLGAFSRTSDTIAPRVTFTQQSGIATATDLALRGLVIDNLSGTATLLVSVDGGAYMPVTFSDTGAFAVSVAAPLDHSGDGAHVYAFRAGDAAGNISDAAGLTVNVDTRAPTFNLTSFASGDALSGAARFAGSVDGTGSGLTSLTMTIDGGMARPITFDRTTGAFNADLGLNRLGAGSHVVQVRATDAAGNVGTSDYGFTLTEATAFTITSTYPADGAGDIGLTQRPKIFFSREVDPTSLDTGSFYATDASGAVIPTTVVVSSDRLSAYLFVDSAMPGAQTIRLHVDGAKVKAADGALLDGDRDGSAGGAFVATYETVSNTPVAGTTLTGFVVGPGPDLLPMTRDDYRSGPDGITHTPDDVFLERLAGVKVYILGRESEAVYTDAQGNFTLTNVPAGDIKVAIDGRTATNSPDGVFFPEMVMDVVIRPGVVNTFMGTMGTTAEQLANIDRGEVYLPRIDREILQDISDIEATAVSAKGNAFTGLTAEERAVMKLMVTPGSVLGEDGKPIADAQVGFATVPPELVRDMLPEGLMQSSFAITIQAPGAVAFAEPLQMTFPNTFDAAPGTKLNFASFDHTTGKLVIEGTATVSADGLTVVTDPGTGISKPGWHITTPPGVNVNVPTTPPPNDPECDGVGIGLDIAGIGVGLLGLTAIVAGSPILALGVGALGLGLSIGSAVRTSSGPSLIDKVSAGLGFGGIIATVGEVNGAGPKYAPPTFSNIKYGIVTPGGVGGYGVNTLGKIAGVAGKAFGLAGAAIGGFQLGEKLISCYVSAGGPLPFSRAMVTMDAAGQGDIPTALLHAVDKLQAAAAEFNNSNQNLINAYIAIFGDEIDRITGTLPAGALFYFATDAIRFFDKDGKPIVREGKDLQLAYGDLEGNADLTPEELTARATELAQTLERMSDTYNKLNAVQADIEEVLAQFEGMITEHGASSVKIGLFSFVVVDEEKGTVVARGESTGNNLEVFLPPEGIFTVYAHDQVNNLLGTASIRTASSFAAPASSQLSAGIKFFTLRDGEVDTDGDNLPDIVEFVHGTSLSVPDTDGDGLTDKFELDNGLNPLGAFPASQGEVGSLALGGSVGGLVVVGGLGPAEVRTALVADGSNGLALVDIDAATVPKLLARLPLSGNVVDVAADATLDLAVVAAQSGGLHIVDLSNPATPAVRQTIAGNFDQVELIDGIILTEAGGSVIAYELTTGEEQARLALPNSEQVSAMHVSGTLLYALTTSGTLHVIEAEQGALFERGSLTLPRPIGLTLAADKIFIAEGVLYLPLGAPYGGGYATVDVSDPTAMRFISDADSLGIAGADVALNGSGLGIFVGTGGGANAVDVVGTADPTNTGAFVTRYTLSAAPTAVAIGAGFAYVGDVAGGFHVINYSGFDTKGVVPTANITARPIDLDPTAAGLQLLEGSTIRFATRVADDVQVQKVDVLVDGQVISTDLAYPFDVSVNLPTLAADADGLVTIQIRATDMGGNVGLSETVTVQLIPDTIPPMLIDSNIDEGQLVGKSFRTFTFTFSEALDPDSASADVIRLIDSAGNPVSATFVQLRDGGQTIKLSFDALAEGDYRFDFDDTLIADRAGNQVGTSIPDRNFKVGVFSIEWINPNGGEWTDPANWSTGVVPGPEDDVAILLPSKVAITVASGAEIAVGSLTSNATISLGYNTTLSLETGSLSDLAITGGHVTVGDAVSIAQLTFANGMVDGDGDLTVTRQFEWSGGEMKGAGNTLIDDTATAVLGEKIDLDQDGTRHNIFLGRTLDVAGAASLGQARLYLGTYEGADPVTGQSITSAGTLAIATGGALDLRGAYSDISEYYGAANRITVATGGTLTKSGGGTSSVQGIDIDGAFTSVDGDLRLESGTTYTLKAEQVLDRLVLAGGTLVVEGNASVGELVLSGGTVTGAGDLTVTERFDWTGGEMKGGGRTLIADGAVAELGTPANEDSPGQQYGFSLGRVLEIAGDATLEQARLYMGTYEGADPVTGQSITSAGTLSVVAGGSLDLKGAYADVSEQYSTDNRITVATGGTLTKSGGGTSSVQGIDIDGAIASVDGDLRLESGTTYTLKAEQVLDRLVLAGGTLVVEGNASVGELVLSGGTVTGAGDLTVTERFDWTGGEMKGGGRTLIADGAVAELGTPANEDSPGQQYGFYLGRVLEIAGDATLEQARLYLGTYEGYDPATGQSLTSTGTVSVAAGGSLDLKGAYADVSEQYSTDNRITVATGGTLTKSGGGTSSVQGIDIDGAIASVDGDLRLESGTTYTLKAGQVFDRLVLAGGTLVVEGNASVGALVLASGTLVVEGNASVGVLVLNGGTVTGAGDLTVTERFDWTGGEMKGGGRTLIADGAVAELGTPANEDSPGQQYGFYLGRVLEIAGDATLEQARLYLGTYEGYDPATGQSLTSTGTVSVAAGGSLDLKGAYADVSEQYSTDNRITVATGGTLTKSGGGTSSVQGIDIDGAFTSVDGDLRLESGTTYTLKAGQVLDRLVLAGGTLVVEGNASVGELVLAGGMVTGAGNLTVTERLDWTGGEMKGGGRTLIADGAVAELGTPANEDSPGQQYGFYLGRVLEIAGDATLEQARLYMGTYEGADPVTGQSITSAGTLSVVAGGSLDLKGAYADVSEQYSTDNRITVATGGTLTKSGGGTSSVQGIDIDGAIASVDGDLRLESGTTYTLKAGQVFDRLVLAGGTLVVEGNASVGVLVLNGGTVTGAGDLTVTERFDWTGGEMKGGGRTLIADGAVAELGTAANEDSPGQQLSFYLGRVLEIAGEATLEQARLYMGTYEGADPVTGQSITSAGTLSVVAGGSLDLKGAYADVSEQYSTDNRITVATGGTLTKSGGGTSTIASEIEVTSSGTIKASSGKLETSLGDYGSVPDTSLPPRAGDVVASGGTFTLNEGMHLSALTIEGGTLIVNGNASIGTLLFNGGAIVGPGDLSIDTHLDWFGGEMRSGGTTLIAVEATATIGRMTNADNPGQQFGVGLGRILEISGTVTLEQARLYMGTYEGADPVTGQSITSAGTLSVVAGGSLDLKGAYADVSEQYSTDNRITVATGGTLTKSGGGTSSVQGIDIDGAFTSVDGDLRLESGTTYTLKAEQVLDRLVLAGGTLVVEGNASVGELVLSGGTVTGAGDLTVTERFDWTGGEMKGGGRTLIADGAVAELGTPANEDSPGQQYGFSLGRVLEIAGDATLEQARLYMGTYEGADPVTGQSITSAGTLSVVAGGSLDLKGAYADVSEQYSTDNRITVATGGTLTKSGGGTSSVQGIDIDGAIASVDGDLRLESGTTYTLKAEQVLDRLVLAGGTLVVEGNASVGELVLSGGTVTGAGDLTVTERFDWTGGEMKGGGRTLIADGAVAELGTPANEDSPGQQYGFYLGRVLEIAGDATLEQARLYLGTYEGYDPATGQSLTSTGTVSVAAGGSLDLKGAYADVSEQYSTDNRITVATGGTLTKSGGGTSSVQGIDIDGAIASVDGDLRLESGTTYTLKAGQVFDRLVLAGGTLVVEGNASVGALVLASGTLVVEGNASVGVLVLNGGTVTGAGDLTVTERFDWTGGEMKGGGRTLIADGAVAELGTPANEDSPGQQYGFYLGRVLEIAGDATLEQARLYLGTYEGYDPATGQSLTSTGTVSVAAGGSLDLKGAYADVSEQYSTDNRITVATGGTLTKSGGGTSSVQGIDIDGAFTSVDGDLRLESGTTYTLKAGQVLDRLVLAGGTLVVEGNASVGELVLAGGMVTGAGNLTVTERLDWTGGEMKGGGRTLIADGAVAELGTPANEDSPGQQYGFYLGRVLEIAGDATLEQARLYMGTYEGADPVTGQSITSAGTLSVVAGGSLDLKGAYADVSEQYSTDNRITVATGGTLTKSGGGTSSVQGIDIDGAIASVDGDLRLESGTTYTLKAGQVFDRLVLAGGTLVVEGNASVGVLVLNGGTVTGAGDLTVTEHLDWSGGTMAGSGATIIATSADALLGSMPHPDDGSRDALTLARDLVITGEALLSEAYVSMGRFSGGGVLETGSIDITSTGKLTFDGADSDIYLGAEAISSVNSINNAGTIVKDGGGTSTVDDRVLYSGGGTTVILEGQFDSDQIFATKAADFARSFDLAEPQPASFAVFTEMLYAAEPVTQETFDNHSHQEAESLVDHQVDHALAMGENDVLHV